MADIKDISAAVQSALVEIGVEGKLRVEMDGEQQDQSVGDDRGHDVEVVVTVVPAAQS